MGDSELRQRLLPRRGEADGDDAEADGSVPLDRKSVRFSPDVSFSASATHADDIFDEAQYRSTDTPSIPWKSIFLGLFLLGCGVMALCILIGDSKNPAKLQEPSPDGKQVREITFESTIACSERAISVESLPTRNATN